MKGNELVVFDPNAPDVPGRAFGKIKTGAWHGYYQTWMLPKNPNIVSVSHSNYKFGDPRIEYKEMGSVKSSGLLCVVDIDKFRKGLTTKKIADKIDGGYIFKCGIKILISIYFGYKFTKLLEIYFIYRDP